MKFKRYPDKCYAVIKGVKRGPVAHDKKTALARYRKSGLIDCTRKDKTARVQSIAAPSRPSAAETLQSHLEGSRYHGGGNSLTARGARTSAVHSKGAPISDKGKPTISV